MTLPNLRLTRRTFGAMVLLLAALAPAAGQNPAAPSSAPPPART
jgi:hypothetical protein